jgi:hypothetical protein
MMRITLAVTFSFLLSKLFGGNNLPLLRNTQLFNPVMMGLKNTGLKQILQNEICETCNPISENIRTSRTQSWFPVQDPV